MGARLAWWLEGRSRAEAFCEQKKAGVRADAGRRAVDPGEPVQTGGADWRCGLLGGAGMKKIGAFLDGLFGCDGLPEEIEVAALLPPFEVGDVAVMNADRTGYECRGLVMMPGAVRCWLTTGQVKEAKKEGGRYAA